MCCGVLRIVGGMHAVPRPQPTQAPEQIQVLTGLRLPIDPKLRRTKPTPGSEDLEQQAQSTVAPDGQKAFSSAPVTEP